MANLFNNVDQDLREISNLKQQIKPTPSVDLSQLGSRFSREFGGEEEARKMQGDITLRNAFEQAQRNREQLMGQTAGQIGQNVLGAKGTDVLSPLDQQQVASLTAKSYEKATKDKLERDFRVQGLARQMANQQMTRINEQALRNKANIMRQANVLSKSLTNKTLDEFKRAQTQQNIKFQQAEDSIRRKLLGQKKGSLLLGGLLKGLGLGVGALLAAPTGGLSLAAGASLGGSIGGLGSSLTGLFSRNRFARDLQSSINF